MPVSQALALFVKSVRKVCKRLQDIHKEAISDTIPRADTAVAHHGEEGVSAWKPIGQSLENEMDDAAEEVA